MKRTSKKFRKNQFRRILKELDNQPYYNEIDTWISRCNEDNGVLTIDIKEPIVIENPVEYIKVNIIGYTEKGPLYAPLKFDSVPEAKEYIKNY